MQLSDATIAALIGGIAGLLAGTVASIVAPWVNWGIEKRRKKLEQRIALINRWRALIASPFKREILLSKPEYGALEPLLSEKVRKQLRRPSNSHIVVVGGHGDPDEADQRALQQEIARIEREWGLV